MTKINSRSKGARGERLWRDQLRAAGFMAERGQQRCGSPDSPDVKCPNLPDIHFEVKHVEKLNLRDAWLQAQRDAGLTKTPILAHKKNNQPWLVTMSTETFFHLIRESDFVV